MGARKKKNDDEGEKKGGDGGGGGGKKEAENPNAVVFRVDMHCEGCANKIIRCVKGFEGVESVKAESEAKKLTVVGKVDPLKLQDKLATKTKKKVELISPIPKKEKESKPKPDDNKADEKKKPKELTEQVALTMAVLKVGFHCQGCVEKIHKLISKTKGVQEMSMDKEKELVTVKGTMDVKALCESLKERVKRPVEVVPPKKDKEKEKEKEKEGGEKKEGGKKKGGGGGEKEEQGGVGTKMEGNRMEVMTVPGYGYGYGLMPGYEYGYGEHLHLHHNHLHAPQTFSDENPNACSIM